MPHIHKNRNSRNNSRSSNASSQGKPVVVKNDDDDFSTILLKSKPTSKKSTPNSSGPKSPSRAEFLEPLSPTPITPPAPNTPPPTPWENLNMTETDYHAMMERVHKQYLEIQRRDYVNYMLAELDSPSYWYRRIESLEKERQYFNKKRGWSAADIMAVDRIDAEIAECEDELDRLESDVDRLEAEYD